jgi:hypothetical protein
MTTTITLLLYFSLNGKLQKPVSIPMDSLESCQAALIEGNTLLVPKGLVLKHAECKQRIPQHKRK